MKFNEAFKYLSFKDAYIQGTDMYISNSYFNSLFRIDLINNETQYLGRACEQELWKKNLHQKIFEFQGCLYLFSVICDYKVSEYNLITKTLVDYSYDEISIRNCNEIKAGGFIIDDEIVWIIPGLISQPLVTFNMNTKKFIKYSWWNNDVFKNIPNNLWGNYLKGDVQIGKEVWGIIEGTSYLICTSLEYSKITVCDIGNGYELNYIVSDKEDLYLSADEGKKILKWNLRSGIQKIFELKVNDLLDNVAIHMMISLPNMILLVPRENNYIFKINRDTDSVELFTELSDDIHRLTDQRNIWPYFGGYLIIGQSLYLLPYGVDKMVEINLEDHEINLRSILLQPEMEKYYITEVLWQEMESTSDWEGYVTEKYNKECPSDNRNSLPFYIKYICSIDETKLNTSSELKNCGKTIWQEMKNK